MGALMANITGWRKTDEKSRFTKRQLISVPPTDLMLNLQSERISVQLENALHCLKKNYNVVLFLKENHVNSFEMKYFLMLPII